MKLFSTLRLAAAICGLLVFAGPVAHSGTGCLGGCAVFDRSVQAFQASGPVSLNAGQTASACATNLDGSPVFILIALLQADNGSLLGTQQVQLPAGGGSCLNFNRTAQSNIQSGNIIGVIVANGHLTELGVILQDRPGSGGCIAASLQIQSTTINNTGGQTFLYVPMKDFLETGR